MAVANAQNEQRDEEGGLAVHHDVALYSLPRDRWDGDATVHSLEQVTPRQHVQPPRYKGRWAGEVRQSNEVHTRSRQTGLIRQSAPKPDVRMPLGKLSRHHGEDNRITWSNQPHLQTHRTRTARQLVEAPNAPRYPPSPTHDVFQDFQGKTTTVQSRRSSADHELQHHPARGGYHSPELPPVPAQPPRLNTPRFSRQALVFDLDMAILQRANYGSDKGSEKFAEGGSSVAKENAEEEEEEEGASARVPSYVSEDPPPSYMTEAAQDREPSSRPVSYNTAVNDAQ